MIINNIELEDIDIYDLEVAEKYEKAIKTVQESSIKVDEMSLSQGIRLQCNLIFDVFNSVFGEGTDKKIFGDRVNLLICLKSFEELVTQVNEQNKEIEKMANKYSSNRAQRRTKK